MLPPYTITLNATFFYLKSVQVHQQVGVPIHSPFSVLSTHGGVTKHFTLYLRLQNHFLAPRQPIVKSLCGRPSDCLHVLNNLWSVRPEQRKCFGNIQSRSVYPQHLKCSIEIHQQTCLSPKLSSNPCKSHMS